MKNKRATPRHEPMPKFGTEASYRIILEQVLVNFESGAERQLARIESNPRKYGYLIAECHRCIQKVTDCRAAISAGNVWEFAYQLLGLLPPETMFFANKGELSWRGAKKGGGRKDKADRDVEMAQQYLTAAAGTQPKRGKVALKQAIGERWGMEPSASVKAIDRGLARLKK